MEDLLCDNKINISIRIKNGILFVMFPFENNVNFTYGLVRLFIPDFTSTSTEVTYHRHFRKCAIFPTFRIQTKISPSFETKRFKCAYSKKFTLLNLFLAKYLEPGKEFIQTSGTQQPQFCKTLICKEIRYTLSKMCENFDVQHKSETDSQ